MSKFTQYLFIGAIIICIAVTLYLLVWWQKDIDVVIDPTDETTVAQGKVIYAKHCASCHGKELEGQQNWKQRLPSGRLPAPPHDSTGHTWHHPDKLLFKMTKFGPASLLPDGQYQSDMPGFKEVLSDEEIIASLAYIKSTWPIVVQKRHDEINVRTKR